VRALSAVFLKHRANVEELRTELRSEPMSGVGMLECNFHVLIPEEADLDQVKSDLEAVAVDLMVDLNPR